MEGKKTNVPRLFTKRVYVLDTRKSTICGRISQLAGLPYCKIESGRVVSVTACAQPSDRGYVLEIEGKGAYRIVDGQDTISLMIDDYGVSMTTGRWEEYAFEMVSVRPHVMKVKEDRVFKNIEIKHGRGCAAVPPYMRVDREQNSELRLPGTERSDMDVSTYRQKRREEREGMDRNTQRLQPAHMRSEEMDRSSWSEQVNASKAQKYDEEFNKFQESVRQIELEDEYPAGQQDDDNDDNFGLGLVKDEDNTSQKKGGEEREKKASQQDDFGLDFEEECAKFNYLTDTYSELVGKIVAKNLKQLGGKSMIFPQLGDRYTEKLVVLTKECNNVPLYNIDEIAKEYRFAAIGTCKRIVMVAKGNSFTALPAGAM
ncbi:NS2 [Warrego virus]|uniref:Non-structural protein NS2 n=1 Tax=Warrego virus TaxID=40062 RepID=A0A097I4F0_9REOV|nr:NS2 [Warrego virus]AIT55720.1 NS2 [Warrego virus]